MNLILIVLLAGIVCWLINQASFIDGKFKQIALWLILALVVLYVVSALFPGLRFPR